MTVWQNSNATTWVGSWGPTWTTQSATVIYGDAPRTPPRLDPLAWLDKEVESICKLAREVQP